MRGDELLLKFLGRLLTQQHLVRGGLRVGVRVGGRVGGRVRGSGQGKGV